MDDNKPTTSDDNVPSGSGDMPALDSDTVNRAHNYAWEWFKFHAKQRTDVFNYFLVTTGILAAAYGSLLQHSRPGLACIIAIGGVILSIGFVLLDVRNKQLVDKSANILDTLEKEYIFKDIQLRDGPAHLSQKDRDERRGLGKIASHMWVFRSFQFCAVVGWLLLAIGIVPGRLNNAIQALFAHPNTGSKSQLHTTTPPKPIMPKNQATHH